MADRRVSIGLMFPAFKSHDSAVLVAFAGAGPYDEPFTWHYEWGLTAAYGDATPVPEGEVHATPVAIPLYPLVGRLEGLRPATTYHYRLAATNSAGVTVTRDFSFETTTPGSTLVSLLRQPGTLGPWTGNVPAGLVPPGATVAGTTLRELDGVHAFSGELAHTGWPVRAPMELGVDDHAFDGQPAPGTWVLSSVSGTGLVDNGFSLSIDYV